MKNLIFCAMIRNRGVFMTMSNIYYGALFENRFSG